MQTIRLPILWFRKEGEPDDPSNEAHDRGGAAAHGLLYRSCRRRRGRRKKLKAVTTFTVIADMAQNVAGDAAVVEIDHKPGAEIHNYQPTPRDYPQGA